MKDQELWSIDYKMSLKILEKECKNHGGLEPRSLSKEKLKRSQL